jgi:formylglycine-generating enzyme required for sulfatase activity
VVIGIIFGGIITIGSLFIWAIINNGIGVPHPIDTPTATHVKIITPSTSLEPTLIQTEAPDPLSSLPNKYTDDFGVPMVRVPAGSFQKGNEDIRFDEQHVHIVMLDDFYIDQYEVTNALFAECFKAGVCNWEYAYATINNPDNIDHPAIYVDWETARKYCEWRGARLPTEAEWEKTARGGLEGMTHPRGNDPPSM